MTELSFHPASERLEAFVEGSLDGGDRAVLESHVVGCSRCQGEVEDLRSLFAALARMERYSPAKGFVDRVMLQVRLPDPWYVRAGHYVQTFVPRTSRGWAFASGFLALPLIGMGTIMLWLLSKPYVTSESLLDFIMTQIGTTFVSTGKSVMSALIQSDVTLMLTRAAGSLFSAGLAGAGLIAALFAIFTGLSAWILYQNLIRTPKRSTNYVSYSF